MSGHSKWAGIKHKKALLDARRGKMFSKLSREISLCAKHGGGNVQDNPSLRQVIEKAKSYNMPADNIKKAIQRGTGELPGVSFEECVYEGYGPGGVAVLIKALTDNKNRLTPDLRKIFLRHSGNLGSAGCVSWMFSPAGLILIGKKRLNEEDLLDLALEAGAEDIKSDDEEFYEVTCLAENLEKVKKVLEKIGIESAEVSMVAKNYIKLEGKEAEQMLDLMNELDDQEDVQNVYANFNIPDALLKE